MIVIPTPYELMEMIRKEVGNDTKETILETVDLLDEIRNDPNKFTYKLENELEKFAEENNRCSMCGQELATHEFKEQTEYQGSPCDEPVYRKYCINHGYID